MEQDAVILRAVGPILTAVGSIVLAMRLEAIIDAILLGMDANLKAVLKTLEPAETRDLEASQEQVLKELRKSKRILWAGFSLLAVGGIVNALSYFIN
jgi:hypothetical protein